MIWVIVGPNDVIEAHEAKIVQVNSEVLFAYLDGQLYTEEVEEKAVKTYTLKELVDNMEFRN